MSMAEWKYEGSATRTTIDIAFASGVPAFSKVWLTAFWFNARQQTGPLASPVTTNLSGGVAKAA